jgi:hypothetical protein
MIRIKNKDKEQLTIKQYPTNQWLVSIFLFLFILTLNYYGFYKSPIHSTLNCNKGLFNSTNCELVESALLNKKLTDQYIKNIKKPKKAGGRSNVILLKTEVKVWNGYKKNIYYPTNWFFDPALYHTDRQVTEEISKLNNFIHNKLKQRLIIEREVPFLFHILVWFLLLLTLLPIILIFIHSITTYIFEPVNNRLLIKEFTPLTKEATVSSENLETIELIVDGNKSILIKANDKEVGQIDFDSESEFTEILASIKQLKIAIA